MSDPESNPVSKESKEDESSKTLKSSEENGVGLKLEKKRTDTAAMNATTSEDSEYETMEEDNGESASSRSSHSRRSSFSEDGDNISDDLVIQDEREDGDGQEENSVAKDKKLDDDEDRRNPQYIPKKGTFYEHDDRTMMDENSEIQIEEDPNKREKSEEVDKEQKPVKKGKVWTEKADRWAHDLYNDDEQKPKSTQELIDTYGYDIRNEEAPPKARRRRRYGRGPNKYTRNWEDEDAYTRSVPVQRRVFHNNREEFPDLNDSAGPRGPRRRDKVSDRSSPPPKQTQTQQSVHPQQPTGERDRGVRREQDKQREERPVERDRDKRDRVNPLVSKEPPSTSFSERPLDKHPQLSSANNQHPPVVMGLGNRVEKNKNEGEQRVGRGRGFRGTGKPRPTATMEFIASASRGRTAPPAFSKEPIVPDTLKHAADMLVQDFSHIYVSNNNNNTNNTNNNSTNIVEETIIPRSERHNHSLHQGGETSGGGGRSKRYSTQRQRSLPETTPPPTYSPPHSIPYYTQPPPSSYVPAQVYPDVAPPAVTSPPIQMVAFLPPGPPPTATAAPPYPPPPLLNYIPPPTYPPMALQPPISGQFEELSPAAELYQSQGGITYYSTQTQSALPRPNPPRRVKLAIPIVPPPDKSGSKQRGGATGKQQEVQSAVS